MNNKSQKTYNKIMSGKSDSNIKFNDLHNLLLNSGFETRQNGTSHIKYFHSKGAFTDLQIMHGGKAKPYQVKRVRQMLKDFNI